MLPVDRPMRISWLLIGMAIPTLAAAETRKTTTQVTVRKRAGEKAAAVVVLPAGTAVDVVREEGRWVLVRVKGGEGYVTRTNLDLPPTTEPGPAPAWSAPRRTNGALALDLYVQVTAAAGTLRTTHATTSPALATLPRGARLAVVDGTSDPAWLRGRDDQGRDGWIARAEISDGTVHAAADADPRAAEPTSTFRRRATRSLELRGSAGLGYRSLGMDLTSNSDGGLTNYLVDANAVAAAVELDATLRPAGPWLVGFDGSFQTSVSSPGIDYPGPTSAAGKVPFETVAGEIGVRAGRRVRTAFDLSLRLAGHYDAFLPRDVENAGMLPRERLAGATIGARVELRPPTSRFAATLRTDVLVFGKRAQTPGLEDGTSSTARAVWGGLTVHVAITARWAVFGAYDFARMSTSWSGMSTRQPGVTSTHRIDTSQLVQLGIGAEL